MLKSNAFASLIPQPEQVNLTQQSTILLVEDNPDDQFIIQHVIKKANLAVSIQLVENAEEAISYLKGQDSYADRKRYPLPTLIITSVDMPYLLGLELLAWVKQQPELKHLPIVVISNSAKGSQPMNLDYSLYFVKTPPFSSLIDIVATLITAGCRL